MSSPIFSLSKVGLTYQSVSGKKEQVEALMNINFEVNKGEFFTIVGPSGCGKTTLLKLMRGLIRPSHGEIFFEGKKLTSVPKEMGMAFQDPLLLPWRSVKNNVLLPIEILKLSREEYTEKAEDLLKTVGLKGFENKASWQLSGGMQQRVNLCRALIYEPDVLLLDEPFGALDAFTREELWLIIQRLHRKVRCTIILVTHQLNEAVFLSDRVIVLSRRPAEIVYEQKISLAKPRKLKTMSSRDFIKYQDMLRSKICK